MFQSKKSDESLLEPTEEMEGGDKQGNSISYHPYSFQPDDAFLNSSNFSDDQLIRFCRDMAKAAEEKGPLEQPEPYREPAIKVMDPKHKFSLRNPNIPVMQLGFKFRVDYLIPSLYDSFVIAGVDLVKNKKLLKLMYTKDEQLVEEFSSQYSANPYLLGSEVLFLKVKKDNSIVLTKLKIRSRSVDQPGFVKTVKVLKEKGDADISKLRIVDGMDGVAYFLSEELEWRLINTKEDQEELRLPGTESSKFRVFMSDGKNVLFDEADDESLAWRV